MPFVTDVSALLGQLFGEEAADYAEAVIAQVADEGAVVPQIFWYEIRNALVVNERRKRLTPDQSANFLAAIDELGIEFDDLPAGGPVIELARRYQLSIYDAAYLELAHRQNLVLATVDKNLRIAAQHLGLVVYRPNQ